MVARRHTFRRWLAFAIALGLVAIVAVVLAPRKGRQAATAPAVHGCTVSANSLSELESAVAGGHAGAVVCVMPGSYGALRLTRATTPGENVLVEPRPSLNPRGDGKVGFSGITIAGSHITVRNVYSTGGISVGGDGGDTHDVIDHDDVSNPHGYGISILSPFEKPASDITISGNRVHDTCASCEGDALRIDGWRDVTITGNDIYNIRECPSNDCHTDTLQSYQGDTSSSGLTVTRNYVHDSVNTQGLAFLKDGDIQDVTIADNLSVRMASSGQTNGPGIDENTVGLRITRNTYVHAGGYLEAGGTTPGASAYVAFNVFNSFNIQPPFYRLTEGHDIYTGDNQWSFKLGAGSALESEPRYMCGSGCGNGTSNGDDYRLVGYHDPHSPDYGIGIDWNPATQVYGPVP